MHLRHAFISLIVSASVVGAAAAASQQADQLLLDPPPGPLQVTPPAHARNVEPVGINFALLDGLEAGDGFDVHLAGKDMRAIVYEVVPQIDGYTVVGRFHRVLRSSFCIAVVGDAVAGWFDLPGAESLIRVRYGGDDGLHYLHTMDHTQFPPCGGTFVVQGGNEDGEDIGGDEIKQHMFDLEGTQYRGGGGEGDGGDGALPVGGCFPPSWDYFDIAVFYTDDARAAAGGTNAIRAECAASVAVTWQTYGNSLLSGIRPRLVHRSEVTYSETGSTSLDLNFLLSGSAGLGVCHTRRNSAAADMAVLLTDNGGGACGRAPCLADEEEAYAIVIWDCAVDNFSFPHELGHIIGCDHDEDAGEGTGCLISWGLGNYFWVPAESMWRHTVMSYSNNGSSRIPYYSHPQVEYMGVATGDSGHDNVSVIFSRTDAVEGFRPTRMNVWVDFGHGGFEAGTFSLPFNTVGEGVNRVLNEAGMSEIPILHIKQGSRNEAITITKPMFIEACGGDVVIGL